MIFYNKKEPVMKSQSVHSKHYCIEIYSGTVTDFSQRSETHVSGSGSEGSVEIKTKVTNHFRFFLVDENGVEKDFQITNWDFPMRVGHQIQVLVLCKNQFDKLGQVVGLKNINMNEISINEKAIDDFAASKYQLFKWLGCLLFGSILFFMIILGSGVFENSIMEKLIEFSMIFGWVISFAIYMVQSIRLASAMKSKFRFVLLNY